MSEPTLKPFTGKLDDNTNSKQQPALKPFTGALDGEDKGFLGQAKDHAVSFLGKGTVGVGEVAVGLSDMMSDGATGKILSEKLGYDPKAAKNVMTGWQSEQYQQQLKDSANIGNRKIEEGDDFATKVGKKFDNAVDITKNAISNPSLITNTVAESLPSMFLGGVLGRASGIANPVVAGAVGEGAVMAGSQAEQIRQETVDGRLTADQSLASVGTGALGGLFGYAGGRLAQKMGLSDVDTAMQTGRLTTQQVGEEIAKTPMRAIPTAVIKGAISEGFLEELPQSVSEQILQNLALDKPWHDGVENAAVMGALAGMAMGGTVSGVGKTGDWWNSRSDTGSQDNQQQSGSPNLPSAPSQFGSNPDSALTGEYIPRGNVPQGDNQGRTAFVYDQPSMDADNLLNNNGFDNTATSDAPVNPNDPDTPPAPNGNYFDNDYGSDAAFDDLLNAVPPTGQTPSQQMGIDPNAGPMSSAAALAVDSGASPVAQLGYTPMQQTQEQSDTPISDAVPSNYQSLLGSQNDGQPFDARFEDATVQQGNAQADNAGKSISQQYDTNAADAMGGGIETDRAKTTTAQTVQPILGQDGKNKWFGTQEKAQAFIDKKDLGNDYQVVQDGKRFEIQPKAKSLVQDDAYFQSQLDQLDKQRAQFESSGDYANAEKVYAEMQTVAREWQTNPSTDTPTTKRAEPSKGASDNAWADFYRKNRNMMSEELFMGGHQDRNALEEATPEIQSRHAHGMAKATPAAAVRDLKDILENGIDQNRGQGRLFTAPLSQGKLTAEQRSAMSASGTSSGSAYSDGAFTLIAKEGVGDIRSVSEIDAVMVNSAVPQEVVNGLRQDFPDMKFGYAKELPSLLSGGKQSNNAQAQVAELEQQLKNEKSVPEKAQIRKQITELQNGLIEQAQRDVPPNNELQNADIKNLADSTQETTPPNAAPNIEDLVSVTTNDGETHMVLASELNDSNVKNLTKFSAQGKRVAVKLPRGRIASTSEQSQQPKQGEQQKVEANEQRESKIQSFINKWNQLKENGTASELDNFYKKVKIALNGYAQGKGVVAEFEQLKADIENFAKDYNKLPKTEQSTNTDPSAAETSTEQITAEIDSEATKTEATQKPKVEVSENKVVTEERRAELEKLIKAKLSQLNSGIDPELIVLGTELALYHIERGVRTFAAYAKAMTESLGDNAKPFLKSWYMGVKYDPRATGFDGMSSAAEVENFDLDDLDLELGKKKETVVMPSGRESDDEASRNKSDLQEDEVTNVEPSQKLKEMMDRSKQRVHSSKQIIVDEHNFLNIGSSILTGQPVYTLWNDRGNYFTVDVDSIKPNATFNQAVIDKARAVKKQEEQRDAELVKKYPNGVFSGTDTQVVTTENVPKKVKEYLGSLLNMLGMDTKVFLATSQDINAQGAQEKYHIYGGHRSILSTQVNAEENGATRLISINQSDFNDAYIALNSGMSEETMIEVIAHELGHIIEKTLLKSASQETQNAIKADFQQWLGSVKGVSKREHLALMRNRHIAQMNMQDKASIMDTSNANLSPYWFSFSEWFADQVSRWTTTSEKPLSLVEKFFASVAKKLKQLAQIVNNTKESYQPSVSVRDYLNSIARTDFLEELYPQQSELQQQFEAKLYASQGLELPENQEDTANEQTTSNTASTTGQSRQNRSANAANAMADNAENEAVSTQSSADLPSTNEQSNGSRQSGSTRTSTSRKNKQSTGSATGTGATTASSTKRSDKPITAASGKLDEKIADDLATKVEQANPDITDFVITDNSSIGKGSLEQKFNDNIAAIQTVHKLDAENRLATPEERQIIARYIGWGGLSNAFDENAKGWEAKAKLLKSLLSEDDYKNAINTVNSAFFTPTTVTRSMWDMVEKLGFKGGLVLEPSVGVGNFLGVSPKGMENKFIGVEYDGITSRIAQHLYPSSTIIHSGYEAMPLADNMFDLVIANPPYGSKKEIFKTKPHLNKFSIHNQFIIGNIENLKPNGIAVIVVTHSFMDAADNSARKLVASMSNLVAAVRLPENTFKENANTSVITDILIFQKFDEATKAQFDEAKINLFPDWVNSGTLESKDGQPMSFSNYFTKGKGKVIGKVVNTTNQFGGSTFTVKHDGNLKADLAQFVSELPLLIEPNTAKSIAQKAEIDFNNATSHMILGSSNIEVGSVGRNSNGQLTRVVERENEFGGFSLVEEIITPDTVWSKSYSIDANGNYFKLVVALDEKGKPQKVLNKAGKPTNFNVYVRQIVPVDKISTSSKLGERKYKALQALVSMRDLLKEQIRLERYGLEGMERNRKLLAKSYHDFVKPQKEGGYGFINAPYAAAIVNELPDAALLFSLEKSYKKEVKVVTGKDKIGKNIIALAKPAKATPADILSKQVLNVVSDITRADTIEDALAVSLSQTGKVDIDLIASLLESDTDAVIKQLHDSRDNPLAFFDPTLNNWVSREKYLAGNVHQKLKAASNANLEKNIESLERVLPKTIPIENISLALGMEWIPESVYAKFASYITGDQNAIVKFNHVLKEYAIEATPTQEKSLLFGTERMPPNSLLNYVMNSRSIIIRDYVKHSDGSTSSTVNQAQTEAAVTMAETVKNEFLQWIYGQQDIVEQLANVFNYVYNSMVLGKFDGSHLKFVGKVPDEIIKLRKHQIDGIWRGVTNSFVLYDHAVGSGKTFTGIARAIERKRLGLSKKPLMVVPNHMVEQFAADVYRLYPGANVLAAGRKKFTGENRRKLFARIATGDYDLIIVPHSSFSFMSMSSEFEVQFIEKQVDQVVDAIREAENSVEGKRSMTVKRLRDLYATLTSRLEKKRNAIRKDRMITFEEMGIDDITVDEAHEFKNLFYNTNLKGIVGLGQTSGSNKAFDLFMKFQYLHQMGYSGAFMTGTPISNSAVEMHAMMRYLMPNELEQLGLGSFDSWQKMFANNTAKFEATESGQLKLKSRFARDWKNMSVLMNSWYNVVDPVTNEDVKRVYKEIEGIDFPLPRVKGGSRQSVVVAPDPYQEMLLAEVLDGFARLEDISDPKEKAAERFRLFDKAKKLSLDARSVNPIEYADAEGPKIKAVTASVFDLYKKWNKDKGTQIIFLDRSVPKSKGDEKQIKEYDELVNKMEQAERDGDDDLMLEISEKLDKYDSNEINEMRIAAQGGWTAYDEIKRQLIVKGIPADEIAFIHDANNDEEKQALFEKVKSGEVRVLIGNTPRMGAGTNVQDRLVGLHHVDVTWKPSDIEQREGRIIRQGNLLYEKYGHDNFEVVINAYVTERTMDAKLWDINSAKLKTINGIRNYSGEYEMDFGQDADAISMQEIAAIASGDPLMLERVELDAEIQALQREQQQHERRQSSFISQVSKANQQIRAIPAMIKALQDSQKRHDQIYERVLEKFNSQEITIDGEKFDSRDSAELYVRTKYDSAKQKAGEGEKVSVTYKIDGQNFDSMTRANEYIKNGFAMRQPIEIEYNGQTFNDSTDMMSDMFAQNGDKLPSLFKSERENAMTINGIPTDIDIDRDGFKFVMYAEDGTTEIQVLGSQYMQFKDATALRVANLMNAIAKGLNKLDQKIAEYEQRLQSAKDVVKGVSDKIGQAFAKQDVLDAKKERLESVLSQLNAENSNDTKKDDKLYSRKSGSQKTGQTVDQVRETLINRFGKDVIEELERQGKLEIIQDYDVDGIEGFYKNGKAVLVASNLTAESTIPTFLHELGGHAGFQNMMTNAQYNELMKQFDKLVEQGNPVALAAKRLAEREQGLERQQLEYLPYLLTLASTMQQKNVLQRNALQRLIRNLVSHVKAWLFNKFGINLNLNPDDMVALANRMIDKAASNAIGNTGAFSSESADIRFSRVDLSGSINRLSKSFKQASMQSTNQWLKNKAKDTLGIALQALTRRQIMEVYGKLLPQLHRYNHIVELMDADATETSVNADNIVNEWADLKDEQQLAELMHEATLAKIDPAKPFVSGSGTSISKYAQLSKAYNALTPEAQAMYVKARDAYSKHYADVHQAIKERILRSELSNQKKTDLLKQMDDNFFAQSKGVYFPLSRFGKYVVVVRDANGVVESVNRAETLNEAEAVRIELQKQFPNSKVSPVTKDKEFNASRDGVGRGFMSELFKEAGNLGLSAKDQADFEDTLSQLYLASMPDLSWAKHGIHRKGMAGFSQDARRAFAQNMFHGGSYLAKLRYGDQLAEQLDSMKKTVEKEIDTNPDFDQVTARDVYEEMEKRHESYMNPNPHPVTTALTSLGFVYYLGISPAAAIVNLSQTALVAYPMMGAKFGFKKSAAALKAAMADFAKGVDVENRNLDITKSLNTDEKKAYEEALRRGVIDKTQVHSLAGVAQGEDSGLSEKLKPIMKWSSFMFHHAERFNREVTFVAAYRLAKEHSIVENGKPRKLTKDEALEMAIDMTYKGHFDYSAGNRARFMQNNFAKVVLLFKQFAQNMIFTLMRQAYLSMYGMDVNERKEARKALTAILAFHGMAAGLLGLPIATSLVAASFLIAKKNPMLGMLFGAGAAAVFFGAGGDDDDPWDLEVEIRNYAAEVMGDDAANYLFKGTPRALGIDLSGRVGLDNLVIPKYQEGLEGQNLFNSVMAGALGPVAGIGANLFKGGQELGDGNLGRAMEAMLPVFMKNPIKAMRYADEGVQDKTGISIQDEVNAWGVFNQTIGFSPADVRLAYEGRSAIYQKKNRLTERRGELMSMWSRARKHDDQNAMDAIWEEIQAFNEINPKIRINRMQLMQSYRQRENRVNKSEDGIYVARKYEDSREAGAFAFGE